MVGADRVRPRDWTLLLTLVNLKVALVLAVLRAFWDQRDMELLIGALAFYGLAMLMLATDQIIRTIESKGTTHA